MSFLLLIGSHFFLRAPFFPGFYLPMATCLRLCNWAWSLWFYYFWGTSLVMPFFGLWALLLCLISSIWLAAFTCFQHLQWFSLHIEIPQCLPHISPCKSSRIRCLVSMEFKKQVLWKILMVGAFTLCTVYEDLPKGMDIWVLCPGCLFSGESWTYQNKISLISSPLLASLLTNCWMLAPLFFITQERIQLMRLQFRHDNTEPLLRSYTGYFNCNIEWASRRSSTIHLWITLQTAKWFHTKGVTLQ